MRQIDTSLPYVIAFDEVLWDCLPNQSASGGAPANFKYRLQGLAISCLLVSKVGSDALGREALRGLQARGPLASCCQRGNELSALVASTKG